MSYFKVCCTELYILYFLHQEKVVGINGGDDNGELEHLISEELVSFHVKVTNSTSVLIFSRIPHKFKYMVTYYKNYDKASVSSSFEEECFIIIVNVFRSCLNYMLIIEKLHT